MRQTLQPTKELRDEIAKMNIRLGQKLEGQKKINSIKNITSATVDTLIKETLWFNHANKMKKQSLTESIKSKSVINISTYYLYIGIKYANVIEQIQKLPEIEKEFLLVYLNKKMALCQSRYKMYTILCHFDKAKEQKLLLSAIKTANQAIAGQNQDVEMLKKIKKQNKYITAFTEEKYEY